jgi:thymidine kinase
MAKLYFYYSAMNAGKSTTLLQSHHNYLERGMNTLLFTPAIDKRFERGKICSRIGLKADAVIFDTIFNLFDFTQQAFKQPNHKIKCILVDEAQFLTKTQVLQLTDIVDQLKVPVLAYGLRTDFKGELFPGSQTLLALAEELIEIKTICHCGSKATMNMRIDEQGRKIKEGQQIMIGGNESYIATCRKHFKEGVSNTEVKSQINSEVAC